jgi:hypothetical protein
MCFTVTFNKAPRTKVVYKIVQDSGLSAIRTSTGLTYCSGTLYQAVGRGERRIGRRSNGGIYVYLSKVSAEKTLKAEYSGGGHMIIKLRVDPKDFISGGTLDVLVRRNARHTLYYAKVGTYRKAFVV